MINRDDLARAIEEARALVRADGADLVLTDIDQDTARVQLDLLLIEANCAECVMPRSYLEEIVAGILRRSVPGIAGVSIDDPREPMA